MPAFCTRVLCIEHYGYPQPCWGDYVQHLLPCVFLAHGPGVSTAALFNKPRRELSSASLARGKSEISTLGSRSTRPPTVMKSAPSARVRLATEQQGAATKARTFARCLEKSRFRQGRTVRCGLSYAMQPAALLRDPRLMVGVRGYAMFLQCGSGFA
jgi:hypothetical protein